jgi:hypothetical protein
MCTTVQRLVEDPRLLVGATLLCDNARPGGGRMDDLTLPVTFFAEPGPQNTETTLHRALERATALSISQIVVATDSGKTARRVREVFPPAFSVVAVSNPPGIDLPIDSLHDYLPRFKEHRRSLEAKGVKSVPASLSHAAVTELERLRVQVRRVDWSAVSEFCNVDLGALDRVGVGLRIGLTIALTAHLSRVIPPDVDVVTLSGTGFGGGGADTALVVRTAATWREWRVLETIVRPRISPPSET